MNITIDKYLSGLERSVRDLPELVRTWEDIDESLRDEYVEQYRWLLDARDEVLSGAGSRMAEVAQRLARANVELFAMRRALEELMDIGADRILRVSLARTPHATITGCPMAA